MLEQKNIRLKPSPSQRALLIDALPERAQLFESVMSDRGYPVTLKLASIQAALKGADGIDDVSIIVFYTTDLSEEDKQGIAQLSTAYPKPLLVITESADPTAVSDAIAAGASFCQPLGVSADRLQAGVMGAVEIHRRLGQVQSERDKALAALADRRLIDRAKSILMVTRNYTESDAFSHIQKLSMSRNEPIGDIAKSIIEAKELLG
ncbi:MAG: ANTAR domain-containing protein [Pseudomonadota bacterium]